MSIRTRHTISGKIAEVPEHIYNHDILGRYLEAVPEDAKPYLPLTHKPREADRDAVQVEPGTVDTAEIDIYDEDED